MIFLPKFFFKSLELIFFYKIVYLDILLTQNFFPDSYWKADKNSCDKFNSAGSIVYSREGNKRGGLLPFSKNFQGKVEQKSVKYL